MWVTVKLYASLSDYLPSHARKEHMVSMEFPDSATLSEIVASMHLPDDQVHLVLLNGIYVEPENRETMAVAEGDAVAIWPPIAGG